MKNLPYRVAVIVLVTAACLAMLYIHDLNLGLDLKGGVHMVVQVQTEQVLEGEADQVRDQVESELSGKQIAFNAVTRNEDYSIRITGVSGDQQNEAEAVLDQWQGHSYTRNRQGDQVNYTMTMRVAQMNALKRQAVQQARTVIDRRINQYGVAEPSITVYGAGEVPNQIIVELPGVDDFDRVQELIQNTGNLELRLLHKELGGPYDSREDAVRAFNGLVPSEYEILPGRIRDAAKIQYYVVRRAASITGSHLKNARRSEDRNGAPDVTFFLNAEGVSLFSKTTGDHVGENLAIVLDGTIYSTPRIDEKIATEQARITGYFSIEEAEDLALTLRSGALPAEIRLLEKREVGPSLGQDSIRKGIRASILGLVLVVLTMLAIYRFSGVNAVLCLMLNLAILMGILAYFNAALTLPGIAGIILTIGMAVDANILIFERIKEELRLGKTVRSAVESGFGQVFRTIVDTNLTTLVASLFLFQFGTGPLRGFAVTLAVGLIANLFTATFVSKTFFAVLLQRRDVQELSI